MKLRSLAIVCLTLALVAPSWAEERSARETCPHPVDWKPTNEELQRMLSEHRQWLAKSQPRGSEGRANLCNADLHGLDLSNANLAAATLSNANLADAKLNHANLDSAKLNDAYLGGAELNNANLRNATLSNAKLDSANLNDANLAYAGLNGAVLIFTSVAGANLAMADLTSATYAPSSPPPNSYVAGIRGLSTVTFSAFARPEGSEAGLVQLRDLLQKAGLRDLEREATFAIEHGKTEHLLHAWSSSPGDVAEGLFRYVAFDLTAGYGLHPSRALLLIVVLWALLIPIYAHTIWRRPGGAPAASGIYRIWPKDRVEVHDRQPTLDNSARVERLHARSLKAVAWSAYFSLLSTFQIGFREFSVGTWLTRTQPRNFALEPTGWVRTMSGIQSLLSVYLLAIWILTYFGRPLQ